MYPARIIFATSSACLDWYRRYSYLVRSKCSSEIHKLAGNSASWLVTVLTRMNGSRRNPKMIGLVFAVSLVSLCRAMFVAAYFIPSQHTSFLPRHRRSVTIPPAPRTAFVTSTTTALQMGWMDALVPDFLKQRSGDFEKLDNQSREAFGPGPLLVLYNVPETMDNEEIRDMLDDAAPQIAARCTLYRIPSGSGDDSAMSSLLDLPLEQAVDEMIRTGTKARAPSLSLVASPKVSISKRKDAACPSGIVPVLYFSGFTNADMMAVYNVVAPEIWAELASNSSSLDDDSVGQFPAACAKLVPPALSKSLGQVLSEITGDHQDAWSPTSIDPATTRE
jgi:hypothetical protein